MRVEDKGGVGVGRQIAPVRVRVGVEPKGRGGRGKVGVKG